MKPTTYSYQPIAIVESCFSENFGIPRQPGLVPEARGKIRLFAPYDQPNAVRGLEGFSHLWVIFVFHQLKGDPSRSTVRPPRLGGNAKVGVFASRATHRPNPIGLSLVKLEKIDSCAGHVILEVSGLDMLEGTPVLDIKPYLPYAEAVPEALAGYANEAPTPVCEVGFSDAAQQQATQLDARYPEFTALVNKVLALDPRPAFHRDNDRQETRVYGVTLYEQNIRWQVDTENKIIVIDIKPIKA